MSLIINLAPTGIVASRQQSPHLPLSPNEIAKDVIDCAQLGVSMAHIHARETDGSASDDPNIFAEIIYKIREQSPGIIITTTTSGRRVQDVGRRSSTLFLDNDCKPDMASLTLGSMNFSSEASVNSPETIMKLAAIMHEKGIRPELEVFDLGMINFAKILIAKGLIKAPYYFNLILGNPSSAQSRLLHLGMMVNDLPDQSIWSIGGIGRFQTKANALGVIMANGVRVGLEDNLWFDDARTQLASNTQLVERVVTQAQTLGRTIATAEEVRTMLGFKSI